MDERKRVKKLRMSLKECRLVGSGTWARLLTMLLMTVALLMVACGPQPAKGPKLPPTAPLPPPEVTYIGSDGNVWDMTLPNGAPKQWTTDARAKDPNTGIGAITYSGLAWSPDGKQIAVVRSDAAAGSAQLLLLTPDGTILSKYPLSAFSGRLVWSPNGRLIASRTPPIQCGQGPAGNCTSNLVVVDARTGTTTKTFPYNIGPFGYCGNGAGYSLPGMIYSAHHTFYGLDTFAWSPDGTEILVPFGCGGRVSDAIALSNGSVTSGYPGGASFQPVGHLILGVASDQNGESLELTDLTGKQTHMLASSNVLPGNSPYAEEIGPGTWSSDGKTIYYEYQDGLWQVKADGSGAKQVIAGTQISNGQATVGLAPWLSPDGKWLLYLKASGAAEVDQSGNPGSATGQWYAAQPDGSGALALPQATISAQGYSLQPTSSEAIWRP